MKNNFKRGIIISLIYTLTSCGFAYEKELVDNYFLVACDVGEQMSLTYNNDGKSNYSTIISETIFETKWNDRFIVVKTHPADIRKSIRLIYYCKHLKSSGLKEDPTRHAFTQKEVDEIHNADSLAEMDADTILKSINIMDGKDRAKRQVTLYYLLDTKNQNQDPLLYLTENELNIALQQQQVGVLNHSKYFEYLDKN